MLKYCLNMKLALVGNIAFKLNIMGILIGIVNFFESTCTHRIYWLKSYTFKHLKTVTMIIYTSCIFVDKLIIQESQKSDYKKFKNSKLFYTDRKNRA